MQRIEASTTPLELTKDLTTREVSNIRWIQEHWERTTQGGDQWFYDMACPRNFLIMYLALHTTAFTYFVPRGPGHVKLKSQGVRNSAYVQVTRFITHETCEPLYRGGYYFRAMVNDYARQNKSKYAWLNSVHDGDDFIGYLLSFSN